MRKFILFAITLLITACVDQNKVSYERYFEEIQKAESSTEKIFELPLGFRFGMSEWEAKEHLKELLASGKIIEKYGDYIYPYQTLAGQIINLEIRLGFHKSRLYNLNMVFSLATHRQDAVTLLTDMNSRLDSSYVYVSYKDEQSTFTAWTKENLVIELRDQSDSFISDISYTNAPIEKINRDAMLEKGLQKARGENISEDYTQSIINPSTGIHKAIITDANMLVIAVDASPGANFDAFAKTYLDDAIDNGVDIKGCLIVDIKDCQFQKGTVIGKRIGKAFK